MKDHVTLEMEMHEEEGVMVYDFHVTDNAILTAVAEMIGTVAKERSAWKERVHNRDVWIASLEAQIEDILPMTKLLATLEGQKFRGPSRDLLRLMRDEFGIPEMDVEEGLMGGDLPAFIHTSMWGMDTPSKRGSMKKVYQRLEELGVIECEWDDTHYFPEVYWTELGVLLVTEVPEVLEPKGAWKWHEKLWSLAKRELNGEVTDES